MAAPLSSLTSTLKLGKQSAKGTAATTGFTCGRFMQSNMQTVYDYIEAEAEHFCGVNPRATSRKSVSRRSGYIVPFGGVSYAYPDMIVQILIGMGFAVATTGAGTAKTHTCTIDTRANAKYMTALHGIGDGADKFERRVTDGRVEQFRLDAGARGIQQVFAGVGITEDAAAGTETATNEADAMLLPTSGAATINLGGAAFTSAIRGFRFLIQNPVSKTELKLFQMARDDIPQTGIEAGGTLQRLDIDYNTYKRFLWGGTSGTGPTAVNVTGDLDIKFNAAEMAEGATPYSLQIIIPKVEFRIGNFAAQGRELVRADAAFFMIDDNATPISVKVVNTRASY